MRIVIALIVAFGFACPASSAARGTYRYGTACGLELWAKKTLRDPAAPHAVATVRPTTIGWLAHQHAPADADANTRRLAPVETSIWRVRAQLLGYRLEADSDLHLVLRDPQTGNTMIGEIPAPYCVATRATLYAYLRRAVGTTGHHTATRRFWWLDYRGATPPTVTVEGVGFFDRPHREAGMAHNAVELHPILAIER